jgi:type I restriction enzyme S subunit
LLFSRKGQRLIESRITRTAKKKITATEFKGLKVPVPPLALQERFAKNVKVLSDMKRAQTASSEVTNQLFHSLMDKSFKGELAVAS